MERWSAFDQEATDKGALTACEPLEDADAPRARGWLVEIVSARR